MKKMVLLPIEVPDGIFCWGKDEENQTHYVCENFDNEGGHPTCRLFYLNVKWGIEWDRRKPLECLLLKNVSEVENEGL